MPLQTSSATELADLLDNLSDMTGAHSQLDEATLPFGRLSPEIHSAQRAFSDARFAYQDSYKKDSSYSPQALTALRDAARQLAAGLRPLGDHRIDLCDEETEWGTCRQPLQDGRCRAPKEHLAEETA